MTSITLKKINNAVIHPFKVTGPVDTRPIKGEMLFPEPYCNVFLCARKKSGKTVVIQKIIAECSGKETIVLAFCSTVHKDNAWIAIQKYCKKHKIEFQGFQSIMEGKVNFLDQFLHRLEQEAEEELMGGKLSDDEEDEQPRRGNPKPKILNLFGGNQKTEDDWDSEDDYSSESEDEDKLFGKGDGLTLEQQKLFDKRHKTSLKKRDKYQSPEFILIFDDLSHELKMPALVSLLKKNRHYKAKIIISSQYIHDLKPESIKQMDYALIFKGQPEDKLIKLRSDLDLAIDQATFNKIYEDATKEPYSFLYIDVRNEQYRKLFDKMYQISK